MMAIVSLKLAESGPGTAADDADPLEAWLVRASRDELADALREIADADPGNRKRLELRAAVLTADTAAVQTTVRKLVCIDGNVDYAKARKYAARVEQAADATADLADSGPDPAGHAVDLAVEAIDVLLDEYAFFEDYSGAVASAVSSMFDAHLHACEIARPDPERLADYLAELVMRENTGYEPDLGGYAPVLGDEGRTVLRDRAVSLQDQKPDDWRARHLLRLADGR